MRAGLGASSVAMVMGTRPEMIKLGPLIRLFGDAARVIHTGQHYDNNLSELFLAELRLGQPDVRLGVGGHARGSQIGDATSQLEAHFRDVPPAVRRGAGRHQRHRRRRARRQRPAASRSCTSRRGCAASTGRCPRSTTGSSSTTSPTSAWRPTEIEPGQPRRRGHRRRQGRCHRQHGRRGGARPPPSASRARAVARPPRR